MGFDNGIGQEIRAATKLMAYDTQFGATDATVVPFRRRCKPHLFLFLLSLLTMEPTNPQIFNPERKTPISYLNDMCQGRLATYAFTHGAEHGQAVLTVKKPPTDRIICRVLYFYQKFKPYTVSKTSVGIP